ncbi:DUF2804 domain-containing protein [Rhodococcus sp. D2-41]|uniref:DUF2804 domain-containing protein n=1 Tax=Speluncibacter jeojiensis TaxID=2710754 RepID=A0A9X4RER5_9ACTN|nr:DUF2804 domain-containing protein [Rhodococcus sp. D2-41]MDG3009138.1 DUF2804 domain-containing protein [Rhodococcus sp. D2-41]MDG3016190.1 DUF2804 domain-containing protein [Corynebacteriales bacterium D3-21]
MTTHEREITAPVDLCLPDGRLNPDAVGWTRTPLHRCNVRGWGRTKRWEYWCLTTPTHLVAVTVSSLDYLAVNTVYLLEYGGREVTRTELRPLARGVELPQSLGDGPATARGAVSIDLTEEPGGSRIRFSCSTDDGPLTGDLFVALPDGHETLGVVVPWSERRFQYTAKHTARPASGTVRLGETVYDFANGWGVLDHGRGRWPHDITWNWGAASGHTDGRVVGLQLGGKWTVGTGMTENALCVDGRLSKIGEELSWEYGEFTEPWTIRTPGSDRVELTFTPFHDRVDHTDLRLLLTDTHQCFGRYTGRIRTDDGASVAVDRLLGWAEQVHMRW